MIQSITTQGTPMLWLPGQDEGWFRTIPGGTKEQAKGCLLAESKSSVPVGITRMNFNDLRLIEQIYPGMYSFP